MKTLRAERTQYAIKNFIESNLRNSKVLYPQINLGNIFAKYSSPETPILFIISPGSDPSSEVEAFAKETVGADKFQ